MSARTGDGIDRLLAIIDEILPSDPVEETHFRIPLHDGASIHLVHQYSRVHRIEYGEQYCDIESTAPESLRRRLRDFVFQCSDGTV